MSKATGLSYGERIDNYLRQLPMGRNLTVPQLRQIRKTDKRRNAKQSKNE